MSDSPSSRLPWWPFLVGDLALVAAAMWLVGAAPKPLPALHGALVLFALGLGGGLLVYPFRANFQSAKTLEEAAVLASATDRLQELETLTQRVQYAAQGFADAEQAVDQTLGTAREISEAMAREAREFTQFLSQANDAEKSHLKLEVEKVRRAENDWMQVVVGMLDHTHALIVAAQQSGQTALVNQLAQYQKSLHEMARRVGLVAFAPGPEDVGDPEKHCLQDRQPVPAGVALLGVLAPGFVFQGRLIRPAMVQTEAPIPDTPEPEPEPEPELEEAVETETFPESEETVSEPPENAEEEDPDGDQQLPLR